jgi:hypothetical protein
MGEGGATVLPAPAGRRRRGEPLDEGPWATVVHRRQYPYGPYNLLGQAVPQQFMVQAAGSAPTEEKKRLFSARNG